MNMIAILEAEQIAALGKNIPDFKAGDTVKVGYKVTEGTRSRVQNYEGVVIGRKGGAGIFHPLRGHLSPYARMRQRHHHIGALRAQPWHISNRRL